MAGEKNFRLWQMEGDLLRMGMKGVKRDGVLDQRELDLVVAFKRKSKVVKNEGRYAGALVRRELDEAEGPQLGRWSASAISSSTSGSRTSSTAASCFGRSSTCLPTPARTSRFAD